MGGRTISAGKSRKIATVNGVGPKGQTKRRNSCRGASMSGVESYRSGKK